MSRLIEIYRTLNPMAWLIILAAAVCAGCIALYLAGKPARDRASALQAHAGQVMATAGQQAASDAVDVQDAARTDAETHEALAKESADVIRSTPGADLRLDPGLNRVGRQRLCRRASYRDSADCLQFAGRAQPAR